ncbi:MAG: hypothetical protein AAGI23_04315, partial [Bacteroidota bacterium]
IPFLTEQVFRSDEAKNIDDAYRRGFSTKYERKKCRHEIGNYMRSTTYMHSFYKQPFCLDG